MLGVRIPNELNPQRLGASVAKRLDAKKVASHVDVKGVAKDIDLKGVLRQIGNVAEQVEARSEEIRTLSGQAKRLSRRIS